RPPLDLRPVPGPSFAHRMNTSRSFRIVARNALAALALALVAACAAQGPSASGPEQRARQAAERGDHERAAAEYVNLAEGAEEATRDRFVLLAVEQWLEAGDGRRARAAFRTVAKPSGGELLWLW